MTQKEKDRILTHFDALSPGIGGFSCGYCKSTLKPSDCKGCPIYSWGGFDPND